MKKIIFVIMITALIFGAEGYGLANMQEEMLGSMLYFDTNLSNPPGQSCASCHLPKAGFADPDKSLPVSEGVVPGRYGTRNSPSAAYAAYSPEFYFDGELWIGGQFWDGRAPTLEEQAKGPFLNPVEMNNTKLGVIQAIRNSNYANMFRNVYGANSLDNVENAYDLMAKAIAAFERTKQFNSFSSKYDYYLKGQVSLTAQEMRGLLLFNDPLKGNCAACHPSESADGITPPLFTDFSYDNLGIPVNPEIEELIGASAPVDLGLGNTIPPDPVTGETQNGKFKVMTLRNLAKTGHYGHNGYFRTLKDIVHFYNTRDVESWPLPEVEENVNVDELGNLGLTSAEEDDIVAFLLTLSDGFYCRCGAVTVNPIANDDTAFTTKNKTAYISVLSNDRSDISPFDLTTLRIVAPPANGTAAPINGNVRYTPKLNFTGVDTFTYTVRDTRGVISNAATVTVNVVAASSAAPIANDDTAFTTKNKTAFISVLSNDRSDIRPFDLTSLRIVTPPANGSTVLNNGNVRYTPKFNFTGVDTFTYTVRDTRGVISNVATVTVNIN